MSDKHYDVIIIGGRCAGASLAIRLAGKNLNILLVDRANFPSLPNVPSGPFIHPATIRLIDELGIQESEYTHPGSKVEHFVVHFVNAFEAAMPTSHMGLDRNYFYGIDRMRFDAVFWQHAAQANGVTTRAGFAVTEILKDANGILTGVSGKSANGESETFTADLIVGADGRFSFAAREFGAKVIEEKNEFTSATYFANWENVDDYSADYPNALITYNTGKGSILLNIPTAERKYILATAMRSRDAHFGAQGIEQAYLESLKRVPHMWNRLKNARRVTDIIGMRPIENGYREAYGTKWVLVGDAVHYKDPTDGQGIYDALIEAKFLAQAIIDWKHNGISWEQAAARYQQQIMDETHPTFLQTVANIKQTYYNDVPPFIAKTIVRWLITNPDFQRAFVRYLSRAITPAEFNTVQRTIPKMLVQGIIRDIRNHFNAK